MILNDTTLLNKSSDPHTLETTVIISKTKVICFSRNTLTYQRIRSFSMG